MSLRPNCRASSARRSAGERRAASDFMAFLTILRVASSSVSMRGSTPCRSLRGTKAVPLGEIVAALACAASAPGGGSQSARGPSPRHASSVGRTLPRHVE